MVDSYAFSNAIRLIVFLITGKWVNFYFNAFCFSEYDSGQHDHFIRKLTNLALFLRILLSLGFNFSPGDLTFILDAFFTKEFYCIILKYGELTQR